MNNNRNRSRLKSPALTQLQIIFSLIVLYADKQQQVVQPLFQPGEPLLGGDTSSQCDVLAQSKVHFFYNDKQAKTQTLIGTNRWFAFANQQQHMRHIKQTG